MTPYSFAAISFSVCESESQNLAYLLVSTHLFTCHCFPTSEQKAVVVTNNCWQPTNINLNHAH